MMQNTPVKIISKFWSDDKRKKSVVYESNSVLMVDFFYDEYPIAVRHFKGKSIHYAEDAAENYTLGILQLGGH